MQAVIGQLIDEGQQPGKLLDQYGPGSLPATVFAGEGAEATTLVVRHAVEVVLAGFAAGQHPGGVKFTAGAAASGFAALPAQKVERALHHGGVALEGAQSAGQGAVEAPELLAEPGDGLAHDCIRYIVTNTEFKHKIASDDKK